MKSEVKRIFIFIGPPGSGKGSLSQMCVKELGWAQLSTGDLCRRNIAEQTEIGKQIDFFIRSGKLIPDSLMIDMVEKWLLEKFEKLDTLVLDGFPRTVVQAQALGRLLEKDIFSKVKLCVVQLKIDDELIVQRMLSRLVCPNKNCGVVYSSQDEELKPKISMMCDLCSNTSLVVRSDDTADSVTHRIAIYHKHANDLLQYYHQGKNSCFVALDVNKPLRQVFFDFIELMGLELRI